MFFRLIRITAAYVADNTEAINGLGVIDATHLPSDSHVWLIGWLPIIFELSCIINRCKLDVRTRSLTVMFEIIKTYGERFKPDAWNDLFKVIFRIFDFAKINEFGNEVHFENSNTYQLLLCDIILTFCT